MKVWHTKFEFGAQTAVEYRVTVGAAPHATGDIRKFAVFADAQAPTTTGATAMPVGRHQQLQLGTTIMANILAHCRTSLFGTSLPRPILHPLPVKQNSVRYSFLVSRHTISAMSRPRRLRQLDYSFLDRVLDKVAAIMDA